MLRLLAARSFHTSRSAFIKAGDAVPSVKLQDGAITNLVDFKDITKGKVVVLTFPGAFTGTCDTHLPGFVQNAQAFQKKGYSLIAIVANDVFVTNAWAKHQNALDKVKLYADPSASLAKALDLELENVPIFGAGKRFKRTAIVVENGIVKSVAVDAGKVEKTDPLAVLKSL